MDSKIIKKDKLLSLLERFIAGYHVLAPVREDGVLFYRPVEIPADVDLNPGRSVLPPKGRLFPQTEVLYGYRIEGDKLILDEYVEEERQVVLFGVHPCDLRSFAVLDAVFAEEPADAYYTARRNNTIIVGVSCSSVLPECFCTAYGISPVEGNGADIHLTDIGAGAYLVEILTPRGKELLQKFDSFFEDNVAGAEEAKRAKEAALVKKISLPVMLDGLHEKMASVFENPYWEKLSRRCLGCGVCTYVCPTCHCFDIMDDGAGKTGERFRCWDSCLFREYTLHTSGHNPRHALAQRLRNRFFHKLSYNSQRYNIEGCVGCGRCVALCPVNIDIREVIGAVRGLV
jgi:ferredoxin